MTNYSVPDLRQFLRPDDHIIWAEGTAEPLTLTEALVEQRAMLGGVSVFLGIAMSHTLRPEHADFISMSSYGALGTARPLAAAGVLDIIPCHVSTIGSYIQDGIIRCDAVFVQLSPAGPDGRHSLGVVNDYIREAIGHARVILAEINDHVPWTHDNVFPETARIDWVVHTSRPLLAVHAQPIRPIDNLIAGHVAPFITDGATLQIGVGAVPDAILRSLYDRRDLGIHSGTIGDAVLELMQQGIITNARKPIDQGKTVTGTLFGTERLYRYAHNNPALSIRPFSYTHSDQVLRQLPRLVTINSALEVDLSGQINAEAVQESYVGGIGGHADFVRAGHRSIGGRSIIAMPSLTANGRSRICACLSGPITTPRSDTDLVVTEFGVADVRGCGLRERARRLIAIAHPDWREDLARSAHPI